MSNYIDIQEIEELSLNAFPSLQTQHLDGWILRFSNGYAKRANSINPLYDSQEDIQKKIEECERIYREKGLKVIYKLTQQVFPKQLDKILERKGYNVVGVTSVQCLSLEESETHMSDKAVISNQLTDEWFTDFSELNHIDDTDQHTLKQMLKNINTDVCYVRLINNSETIACGMGVLEDGWLGLYDIVTSEKHRNKGYGMEIVSSILEWGKNHAAKKAYLQVMLNNKQAINLYTKSGFVEAYRYWYRITK
ncbi:Acetyltransferase (GNAT) family protein [Gracilibacillus orientalis]|uniref:Acetyltransferase (GNAT) family protein n=1 Tax=Gracilibacillus orientalis TaxID=334253 RepID=A0A1I4LLR4_9BACI|nr:GNAT family N-acetyltransferase [Gracilibacillus orientalis]SFL91974.1 Acetyltransferase (GNAT) family protein [Gracilibacillus orientalis]